MSTFQPRKPAGSPKGGQFDTKPHVPSDLVLGEEEEGAADDINPTNQRDRAFSDLEYAHTTRTGYDYDRSGFDSVTVNDVTETAMRARQCSFNEVDATNSIFPFSELDGSTVTSCSLTDVSLARSMMRRMDINYTTLENCRLVNSDMEGSTIRESQFLNVNASGVSARSAQFYDSTINGHLEYIDLSDAHLDNCDLRGVQARGAILNQASITETTTLAGADLREADMISTRMVGVDAQGANMSGANAIRADFRSANLRGVNLKGAKLDRALFDDADVSGATIDETYRRKIEQVAYSTEGVTWVGA